MFLRIWNFIRSIAFKEALSISLCVIFSAPFRVYAAEVLQVNSSSMLQIGDKWMQGLKDFLRK